MLNNIVIQGRMTRDAELRQTNSGVNVTTFTLAVDRDRKEADGSKKTDFIDCTAWRQTAEYIVNYGGKGRMTIVEGKLHFREWTDKDGNNRRNADIQVDNLYFCDSKNSQQTNQAGGFTEIEDDGALPF